MANDQATLEALLPQLLQLIRGQQYDYLLKNPNAASLFGMSAPQNSVPLNDAIVKMAYGLLPGWAQTGLGDTGAASPLAPAGPRDNPVDPAQGGTGARRGGRMGDELTRPGLEGVFPWNTDMSRGGGEQNRAGYVGNAVGDLDRNYDPNRSAWYDHWYIPPMVRGVAKGVSAIRSKGK